MRSRRMNSSSISRDPKARDQRAADRREPLPQLARRVAFLRAMKKRATAMKFAPRASAWRRPGRPGCAEWRVSSVPLRVCVPLHTLRAASSGFARAHGRTCSIVPRKCGIYQGEVLPARLLARKPAPDLKRTFRMMSPKRTKHPRLRRARRGAPGRRFDSPSATSACGARVWLADCPPIEALVRHDPHIKAWWQVYIRIFLTSPITKKPGRNRMGKGKGGN